MDRKTEFKFTNMFVIPEHAENSLAPQWILIIKQQIAADWKGFLADRWDEMVGTSKV